MQPIQMQLFANRKIFSDSVSAFPNSTSNFECFGNQMRLRGYWFPKLQTAKSGATEMPKKPWVITLMES